MEQLFKCNTVKQRKIMEWLVTQGVSRDDIASTKLTGSALVRITNPAGQYMDLYCSDNFDVRILQVTEEREEELHQYFGDETNDPEDQEWRDDLTPDEAAMVEQWDEAYAQGFAKLACDILKKADHSQCVPAQDREPEL